MANGPYAAVYAAMDTIEGVRVAMKLPHQRLMDDDFLNDFRKEVRVAARLEHPNILPVKDASFIEGHFAIVMPLGQRTLADRIKSRISLPKAIAFGRQMLEAVAYAHRQRVIHCDIKPENVILFPNDHLRLTDFGIAKLARRTVHASGSGTIGYIAPEQAMGRPSFRSDVFSLGLVLYRMLAGKLPHWPYDWPPPGLANLRRRVHPDMIALLRRALEFKPAKRFRDADQMLKAYTSVAARTLRHAAAKTRKRKTRS